MSTSSILTMIQNGWTDMGATVLTILGSFLVFALAMLAFRFGYGKIRSAVKK